jgi:hypothetical protein
VEQFEECYEPVALVYVAAGTNMEAAAKSLSEHVSSFRTMLFAFGEPDVYTSHQR